MMQAAPAASELVQVVVSGKSLLLVPVIVIAVIVSVALPEFFSVTVLIGLVTPVATAPKFRLVGVRVTAGLLLELNVAVTALAADMVTLQVPVPEQAPLQPAKVEPAAAVSLRVTTVPLLKFALQVPGQEIPAGLLLTVPVPVPANVTESAKVVTEVLKVAVTALAAVMVTLQVPVPEQAPLQPAKVDPAAAVAVRVTGVPLAKLALQVLGQVMPAGLLLTDPEPVPASVTVNANVTTLNVAVTALAAVMVTLQVPVPEQAPLQPAKVDPAAAVAVRVTGVPLAKLALQVLGQVMPAGLLLTDPEPVPASVTVSANVTALNVAVTALAAVMVTLQVPVPEQAPLQPAKVDPAAAVAVRVTGVPLAKLALQVLGQVMPAGLLLTDPEPVPASVTVSANVTALNVAVTALAAVMVTLQVPVPEQAPLQPAKVDPAAAVAVRVTGVPLAKLALQVLGQVMPAGLLLTDPEPVPASVTVNANVTTLNVAVTALAAVMVTLQVPVPEQAPLQPAKVDPAAAVAVRVTGVPLAKLALQVLGQVMPAGLLLTDPEPVPASVTVNANVTTLNVAVTALAAVMVTLQVPVPEQAPLQPAKVDPAAAVAVRVTGVPLAKLALQVLGQVMPAG